MWGQQEHIVKRHILSLCGRRERRRVRGTRMEREPPLWNLAEAWRILAQSTTLSMMVTSTETVFFLNVAQQRAKLRSKPMQSQAWLFSFSDASWWCLRLTARLSPRWAWTAGAIFCAVLGNDNVALGGALSGLILSSETTLGSFAGEDGSLKNTVRCNFKGSQNHSRGSCADTSVTLSWEALLWWLCC